MKSYQDAKMTNATKKLNLVSPNWLPAPQKSSSLVEVESTLRSKFSPDLEAAKKFRKFLSKKILPRSKIAVSTKKIAIMGVRSLDFKLNSSD